MRFERLIPSVLAGVVGVLLPTRTCKAADLSSTHSATSQVVARGAEMDPSAHLAQAPATQEAAFAERRAIEALDRIATLFPFEETKHGRVLTLGTDELFDSGSATLTPTAMNRLEDLTSALRHVVSHRIQIRCFTDSLGSAAENLELSRRRAVALKDFLVSHGVDISLLDAMGEGAKHPLSDNATASGRATNRRIEITIEKTRAHVPSPVSQLS